MTPDDLSHAACRGHAPLLDEPLPDEDDTRYRRRLTQAAVLCHACPVVRECAADAAVLAPAERSGVYAGTLYKHGRRGPGTPVADHHP